MLVIACRVKKSARKLRSDSAVTELADCRARRRDGGAAEVPGVFRARGRRAGALAWPNGFDLDPIALYDQMLAAVELSSATIIDLAITRAR